MKNNKKENILTKKIIFGFSLLVLFCLSAKISNAAYLTSDQCAASGGSCNWISNNCNSDETSVGLCQGGAFSQGACCKKTLQDTSGADPDPTGTGIGAGGTLQNPNAGLGGPAGGTVTPGTSGIPLNSASPASISSGSGVRNGPTGGLVPCTDNCTLCHLVLGFKNIYDYLLYIVLFPATVLVIVVAGIMYMVSSGNKGMIDKAKSAFTYALTALILALTAWLLINATLNALGFKNAGNWWNFTCDTTQTTGPGTLGAGGATLPAGNSGGAAAGTGTCGGVGGQTEACKYLTKDLESLLACIKGKMGTSYNDSKERDNIHFLINTAFAAGSLSAGYLQNMSDLQNCAGSNWSKGNCNHMQNSCHYGGSNCPGQINAADLTGSDLNAIRQAATACGGFSIYNGTNYRTDGSTSSAKDHESHVHVSPMNNCGCQ